MSARMSEKCKGVGHGKRDMCTAVICLMPAVMSASKCHKVQPTYWAASMCVLAGDFGDCTATGQMIMAKFK